MDRIPIARRSARVERLLREWHGEPAVLLAEPLSALVGDSSYDRPLALECERLARDGEVSWPLRRLATLMLETALSRIAPANRDERQFWIDRLCVSDEAELAREGYKPGEPLTAQLWRRLARFSRIHRLALAARSSERAMRDFLLGARRDCRLTLARYLFTTDEIIDRIEHDVRCSRGRQDIARYGQFQDEGQKAIERLPAMERALLEHLGRHGTIRWIGHTTAQVINSLVEFPVGTVVMTIKPPGSSHEIEIKRAGRKRLMPFDVVWARDGWILPSSHHLDGGSMHHLLAFEAENSAFFSRIFREVHGFDATMSRTIYMATVFNLPTPIGEVDVIDYFTDRRVWGERYDEMRWNLENVVKTLTEYSKEKYVKQLNDVSLSLDFIGRVKPAQAVQLGTTSFRLERLLRYLAPTGADRYFKDGLKLEAIDADEARRFVDELMDEILGEYEPPRVPWRSHAQYVEAAFRVPANRERANRNYISALQQIGRFWGTLMGIRGHSEGESFVERNAGLRSVWKDGAWQIEVVFMDHDSLNFASTNTNTYRPRESVKNAAKDAKHILGGVYGNRHRQHGELWYMKQIFRIGSSVERRGVAAFRAEMKRCYDLTRKAVQTNPEVTRFFRGPFVEKINDWDEIVVSYLKTERTRAARKAWKTATTAKLIARGYSEAHANEHVNAVTREAKFLRRVSFLFSSARKGSADRSRRPSRSRSSATSRSRDVQPRPLAAAREARRPARAASRRTESGRRPAALAPRTASRTVRRPRP